MRKTKLKSLIFCLVISCFIAAGPAAAEPTFMVDSHTQWNSLLYPEPNASMITPASPSEWYEYAQHWISHQQQGPPFQADTNYCVPTLYVYDGNDPCYPMNNACLVMTWGNPSLPDGNYTGAWKFVYGMDPDLRNCTITLKVYPPGWMTSVTFGLKDISGNIVSWSWGVPAAIPSDIFATIKINTNNIGLGTMAAVPNATSFASNPNFDLSHVASFMITEAAHSDWGEISAPPPGGTGLFNWNAWKSYSVTKNTGSGKYYVKWSQPPDNNDPNASLPIFIGWDERSDYNRTSYPIVADDWECNDSRPVTDIHWWGSFLGWNQPYPPPILPKYFHIGIWTDLPDPDPCNPSNFSHPLQLVWENDCNNWVWNFAGYDKDPRGPSDMNDSCFQFNQLLSQNEWFYQEPENNGMGDPCNPNGGNGNTRVYWLSIAAVYNSQDYTNPNFYPWGWTTRKHFFNDDAVRITNTSPKPPRIGSTWLSGNPIRWPDPNTSWDVAFELSTNEPNAAEAAKQYHTDINRDGIVNFLDFALLARDWLTPDP